MTATAKTASAEGSLGRPVRHPDPERNAAYWARIDANVAAAPELTPAQRVRLRGIFQQADRSEAA
ncbi:hypothetical protein [Streptomyces sp. NBC_01264]|uniref:hypothetical protein n=1 Tax=Streptomyces sp. NBC_01264 TaxID=2903804 RepID=UPI0022507A11|nr:hypothetical protein [Streptomyces sp. NBC_01264]MCX4780089.1 hypothetical protein [Streptomyces sp. NBC_01264]